MKKGMWFVLVLLALLFSNVYYRESFEKPQNSLRSPLKTLFINEKLEGYSKSSIKTELDYSPQFNLSVQVVGLPSLIIESPRNESYFSNESLKLKVISNGESTWYNVDGNTNVGLIGGETTLNISGGNHTINVFANNSYGITKKNVSFYVDLNLFRG